MALQAAAAAADPPLSPTLVMTASPLLRAASLAAPAPTKPTGMAMSAAGENAPHRQRQRLEQCGRGAADHHHRPLGMVPSGQPHGRRTPGAPVAGHRVVQVAVGLDARMPARVISTSVTTGPSRWRQRRRFDRLGCRDRRVLEVGGGVDHPFDTARSRVSGQVERAARI